MVKVKKERDEEMSDLMPKVAPPVMSTENDANNEEVKVETTPNNSTDATNSGNKWVIISKLRDYMQNCLSTMDKNYENFTLNLCYTSFYNTVNGDKDTVNKLTEIGFPINEEVNNNATKFSVTDTHTTELVKFKENMLSDKICVLIYENVKDLLYTL